MSGAARDDAAVPLKWQVAVAAFLVAVFVLPSIIARLPVAPAPAKVQTPGLWVSCPEAKPGEVMVVIVGASHPDGGPRRYRCISVASRGARRTGL